MISSDPLSRQGQGKCMGKGKGIFISMPRIAGPNLYLRHEQH